MIEKTNAIILQIEKNEVLETVCKMAIRKKLVQLKNLQTALETNDKETIKKAMRAFCKEDVCGAWC